MLGNWMASRKASDAVPGPRTRARIMSRATPAMRLTMVRPPIVPVALIRPIPPPARPGSASRLADDLPAPPPRRLRPHLRPAPHLNPPQPHPLPPPPPPTPPPPTPPHP